MDMRFKKIFIKYMSKREIDLKKEIKNLKNIIQEQQKIIELLKERLIDLADDLDRETDDKLNLLCEPYRRTQKWEW